MKKVLLALSAVAALAVAVPTMASAETVVIKERGFHHGFRGAHAMMHEDRGWHRGWRHRHHDVVVIRRGHHHHHGY